MKTALELLGANYDSKAEVISTSGPPLGRPLGQVTYQLTVEQLDLVAKRAREEMREMAAMASIDAAVDGFFDQSAKDCGDRVLAAIRALPTERQPGGVAVTRDASDGWIFTDQKPRTLRDSDLAMFARVKKDLRCGLCGHRSAVGDVFRWVYANGHSPSYGNFFACATCDGPDVMLKRARWMLRAMTEFHELDERPLPVESEERARALIAKLEAEFAAVLGEPSSPIVAPGTAAGPSTHSKET